MLQDATLPTPRIVDLNVSCGDWPFQRFRHRTLAQLATRLRSEGIDRAFVSHLGGIFHPDPDPYNLTLIDEAAQLDGIVPVPVINPVFPGWRDRLESYRSRIQVLAVKIHPNYHRYSLNSEAMAQLAGYLQEAGIPLFLQMRMEDERMRYSGLDVVGVPVDEAIGFHGDHPQLQLICLNAYMLEVRRLGREAPGVCIDIAFTEWMFTMERLLEELQPENILFGSHSPFLYTRAGVDKLVQSDIPESSKRQIAFENARRFWNF